MNAPDRHELLVVPEGQKKVEMRKDTKIPNAATFIIQREDHTLGNLLRSQVGSGKNVVFAGYRMPHPLTPEIELRVQTRKEGTPGKALGDCLNTLIVDLGTLKKQFSEEVQKMKSSSGVGVGGGSSGNTSGIGNNNW